MMVDLSQLRSGFSDRLRLATWGIAQALLEREPKLIVRDQTTPNCPYRFRDICRVEGLEVAEWQESDGPVADHGFTPRIFPARLADVRQTLPRGWKGSARDFQQHWLAAYRRLRPQTPVSEAVQALRLGPDCLGLQLRYTDKIRRRALGWMELQEEQLSQMEDQLLRMLTREKPRRVFLAADNLLSKTQWTARLKALGIEVVSHEARFDPSRPRQTDARDFAVDLFALAACGGVLGTCRSGVVYSADWMNGRLRSRFAVDGMFWSMLGRRLSRWLGWLR